MLRMQRNEVWGGVSKRAVRNGTCLLGRTPYLERQGHPPISLSPDLTALPVPHYLPLPLSKEGFH